MWEASEADEAPDVEAKGGYCSACSSTWQGMMCMLKRSRELELGKRNRLLWMVVAGEEEMIAGLGRRWTDQRSGRKQREVSSHQSQSQSQSQGWERSLRGPCPADKMLLIFRADRTCLPTTLGYWSIGQSAPGVVHPLASLHLQLRCIQARILPQWANQ